MTSKSVNTQSRAREVFSKASPEIQTLIREILQEEREVINMQRRTDIHTRIYEHIRRIIK